MEVKRNVTDERVTLTVSGEIEVYSLPDFTRLAESFVGGPKNVTIDMKELEYIDSSGLGFLVTLHDRLERNSQHLSLTNMPTHVARVFKITRLDRILDITCLEPTSG
jgi:anti-sigma B factor antagonist